MKREKVKAKESEEVKKIRIKVIGIGGGGGNIVSEIAKNISGRISFLVADTDLKALNNLPENLEKFYFGERIKGLGTGMDVQLAKEIVSFEREKIKKIFAGQDLLIFICTLGGGVGSGAGPVFIQTARNLGILSYGIFTLPFLFEGKKKMEIAKNSLLEIKKKINAFSILENERIFQIVEKNTPLEKALFSFNKIISFNLQNLLEIIFKPALINIDFADLRTIFEGHGLLTYLNSIEFRDKEAKEIEKIVHSPIYSYDLEGARNVLFNIAGSKDLSLGQVNTISRTIVEKIRKDAKIIFGISFSEKAKMIVTILATGCSKIPKEISDEEIKKEPKLKILKKKKIKIMREKEEKKETEKEVERKNGLQLKEEIEKEEAKILEKEKIWETPPFLRKKLAG